MVFPLLETGIHFTGVLTSKDSQCFVQHSMTSNEIIPYVFGHRLSQT
ncbi:hypothetical protein RABR111495_17380 [Rahnella bruchi]